MEVLWEKKGSALIFTIIFVAIIILLIFGGAFTLYHLKGGREISTKHIESAEKIVGLNFTQKERKMMLDNLKRNLSNFKELRKVPLQNHVSPALLFNPVLPGMTFEKKRQPLSISEASDTQMPENFEDLAFYPECRGCSGFRRAHQKRQG